MKDYTLKKRVEFYNKAFPDYPNMWYSNNWILGVWNIGNNYKGSGYHGAYPPGYLKRMDSMFPDCRRKLHLFSGSLCRPVTGIMFDKDPKLNPDVVGDAHKLSNYFNENTFDIIFSDPPYSQEDALKYGNPLVNRNAVVKECYHILEPGGFLCWMDMILPMYNRSMFRRVGEISISRSTNHRVRCVFIFRRV